MGFIGVGSRAGIRTELWFYLEHTLASGAVHFEFTLAALARPEGVRAQKALTDLGRHLLVRLLPMPGVHKIFVRPNHLEVLVWTQDAWEGLLAPLVQVIREETEDLQAEVKMRPTQTRQGRWPRSLIEVLFE